MEQTRRVFIMLLFLILSAGSAQAGSVLKDFAFTTLDGDIIEFNKLKGTPMVINIGADWWKKCKDEAPELQKAYTSYKDKGVFFLGVFALSKDKDIRKFVETNTITFPVGKENGIADVLGAAGIPETVFIDKNGNIVTRHRDQIDYAGIVSGINEILKEWFLPC